VATRKKTLTTPVRKDPKPPGESRQPQAKEKLTSGRGERKKRKDLPSRSRYSKNSSMRSSKEWGEKGKKHKKEEGGGKSWETGRTGRFTEPSYILSLGGKITTRRFYRGGDRNKGLRF